MSDLNFIKGGVKNIISFVCITVQNGVWAVCVSQVKNKTNTVMLLCYNTVYRSYNEAQRVKMPDKMLKFCFWYDAVDFKLINKFWLFQLCCCVHNMVCSCCIHTMYNCIYTICKYYGYKGVSFVCAYMLCKQTNFLSSQRENRIRMWFNNFLENSMNNLWEFSW